MKIKKFLDILINLSGYLVTLTYFILAGLMVYEIFWPDDPDLFTLIIEIILFVFCILLCYLSLKTNYLCYKYHNEEEKEEKEEKEEE